MTARNGVPALLSMLLQLSFDVWSKQLLVISDESTERVEDRDAAFHEVEIAEVGKRVCCQ